MKYTKIKNLFNHNVALPEMDLVNPYTVVNSAFNRILELRLKAYKNYTIYHELGFDLKKPETINQDNHIVLYETIYKKLVKVRRLLKDSSETENPNTPFDNPDLIFEFLVTDSIFCLNEMIGFYNIYGISYMSNHTMIASAHRKLGYWCQQYYNYLNYLHDDKIKQRINSRLVQLIGSSRVTTLSPKYHYEMALAHYRKARDSHREGNAYKELIGNMSYLTGDFNDSLSHFCAAIERYHLNFNITRARINEVRREGDKSRLYDIKSYLRI